MNVFQRLFDQAAASPAAALTEPPELLNTVVLEDRRLAALDRAAVTPTAVTVINSTGAGGITALAGRQLTNLALAAVQTAVRDPGDLAGNVARIAAAARELEPDVTVLVEIPDGFGWSDAVAAAEAEGLTAVLGPDTPEREAARLSTYIEADLPFVVDGIDTTGRLLALLVAVDRLVDDPDVDAAAGILASVDHDQLLGVVGGWDANRAMRVRRRLRAVRTEDVPKLIAELTQAGLVGRPAT
jgi:hypothetical protein